MHMSTCGQITDTLVMIIWNMEDVQTSRCLPKNELMAAENKTINDSVATDLSKNFFYEITPSTPPPTSLPPNFFPLYFMKWTQSKHMQEEIQLFLSEYGRKSTYICEGIYAEIGIVTNH